MPTLTLTCQACRSEFQQDVVTLSAIGIDGLPQICPKCNDVRQDRPEIVLSRRCLYEAPIVLDPSVLRLFERELVEYRAGENDHACWRASITGRRFGAACEGRVEIFSHVAPDALGTTRRALLADMEVEKVVYDRVIERRERMYPAAGEESAYEIRRRCHPDDEGAERGQVTDRYLRLNPCPEELAPRGVLVWVIAQWKWTMKGFGRDRREKLSGAENALWIREVRGRARKTGRFGGVGLLAVMAPGDYLTVTREDREPLRFPRVDPIAVAEGFEEPGFVTAGADVFGDIRVVER